MLIERPMTEAERALLEAVLAQDVYDRDNVPRPLKMAVAQERIDPSIIAEYKECLRASRRAQRRHDEFVSRLPSILMGGTNGLTMKLWDEIDEEEGWNK